MADYNKYIKDIVAEHIGFNLIINDDANRQIGTLKPVTQSLLDDVEIIAKLTKWRNQANKYFFTQFIATEERTKKWLEEVVLRDYSRLLFLIYSPTKIIGQCGFKNLLNTTVEIDNLLRGEIGGHSRLIYYSEKTLIKQLFCVFDAESVFGLVLADNIIALNMHASVGFRQTELIPLQKKECAGETYLQIGNLTSEKGDNLFARKIEMNRKEFIVEGEQI